MLKRKLPMADRIDSAAPRVSPGFIALVSHEWNDQWLGRAQVMSRIAKQFHVVWCGPPHEWRAIPQRARSGPSVEQPVDDLPMLHTYRPEPWLPRLYRPRTLALRLMQRRLENARAILERQGCTHIVLSIWSPQYSKALPLVKHDLSMYHINDEYSFARVQQPISAEERVLMAGVDEVFIHSPAVMARKAALCSSATLTPNGVDFDAFAMSRPIPDDLAAIPSPRIGYSGFLKTQLDWELLYETAHQNPQWSFVFVGRALEQPGLPETLARLDALRNVHFLGGKSSRDLAAYPQHFDVCMLPYCVDDYTKYIDPLKLSEYLASGTARNRHADSSAARGVRSRRACRDSSRMAAGDIGIAATGGERAGGANETPELGEGANMGRAGGYDSDEGRGASRLGSADGSGGRARARTPSRLRTRFSEPAVPGILIVRGVRHHGLEGIERASRQGVPAMVVQPRAHRLIEWRHIQGTQAH